MHWFVNGKMKRYLHKNGIKYLNCKTFMQKYNLADTVRN